MCGNLDTSVSSRSLRCVCVSLLPTGQVVSSPSMPHPTIPSLALVMGGHLRF